MSEQQQKLAVKLTKVTDVYFPMLQQQLENYTVSFDEYAKQCAFAAIGAMNVALDAKGIDWNDPQLDKSNIIYMLSNIALLKLNATASPREVYFQVRTFSVDVWQDDKKVKVWKKQIEMGIEGDGNDAILSRFGRGVEDVGQIWYVREEDEFEYPKFVGLEMAPPKWSPTGNGKVVRVVYPITKKNGTIEFHITERKEVIKNLLAHVNNNLMNETFGICEDRYKANADQRAKIKTKKNEIMKKISELGLDALDNPEFNKWMSPAWVEEYSRESMIIRKMRNNVVKKIPKDFGSSIIENAYNEVATDARYEVTRQIAENANTVIIDIDAEPVQEQKAAPKPQPQPQSNAQPESAPEQPAEEPADKEPSMEEMVNEAIGQSQPIANGQPAAEQMSMNTDGCPY